MGSDVLIVLVIVLVIVVIWQGPKNLPKLGSAFGRSISDFRKEVNDDKPAADATPSATPTTASEPPKDEPGS